MPRRGFYLIVDPGHRELGALPATAWIDDLMRFHGVPYYVGLLTAAALHGAAHQQPMAFGSGSLATLSMGGPVSAELRAVQAGASGRRRPERAFRLDPGV